jgi:hypothetical protein
MTSLDARLRLVIASVLSVMLAYALSRTAHAEVRVEGAIDSLRIEIRDGSVHEALTALSAKFGVRVLNSAALDQPISGTYQGSLQQVVARLLAGHNYVATYSATNAKIRIFDPGDSGKPQPGARRSDVVVVAPNTLPTVAVPAPAQKSFVDKGQLIFVPR